MCFLVRKTTDMMNQNMDLKYLTYHCYLLIFSPKITKIFAHYTTSILLSNIHYGSMNITWEKNNKWFGKDPHDSHMSNSHHMQPHFQHPCYFPWRSFSCSKYHDERYQLIVFVGVGKGIKGVMLLTHAMQAGPALIRPISKISLICLSLKGKVLFIYLIILISNALSGLNISSIKFRK